MKITVVIQNLKVQTRTFGQGASHVPASFAARTDTGWTVVLEGPEDAAVVAGVMGWRSDATLGSGSLDKPPYPAGSQLDIFGDNTKEGRAQTEAAAATHRARGCIVAVAFAPGHIKDAKDLLRARGPGAVRVVIEAAIGPKPKRPNCDIGQLRTVLEAETEAWAKGEGPLSVSIAFEAIGSRP